MRVTQSVKDITAKESKEWSEGLHTLRKGASLIL